MARTNIPSGKITAGWLYSVEGSGTVTYNGTPYVAPSSFLGAGVTTYTVTGTPEVYLVTQIKSQTIAYEIPKAFPKEKTSIKSQTIALQLHPDYKEETKIK